MSETISAAQRKRISRITRRAIPAVREAYESGLISARRADCLLYLPKAKQARQLAALLQERGRRERSAKLAAEAINSYLRERGARSVDLMELQPAIRQRLAAAMRGLRYAQTHVFAACSHRSHCQTQSTAASRSGARKPAKPKMARAQ
jgi:hypothetical protein